VFLVVSVVGTGTVLTSARTQSALRLSSAYQLGQAVDTGDIYSTSAFTVILFVRSSCGASVASVPAFRAIAQLVEASPSTRIVVVPTEAWSKEAAAFVGEMGLSEAHVRMLDFARLKVKVVPTLLVVDRVGRIRLVQEGIPPESRVEAVQSIVG
jgi:hypothetical protein